MDQNMFVQFATNSNSEKQVIVCDLNKYSKGAKSQAMVNECIDNQFNSTCTDDCLNKCEIINHKQWICYTCHRKVKCQQMHMQMDYNYL
jgi:hypothetical protein